MPIKFPCPSCKKGLTAKDEQAGKKVMCPACKKPLVIPRQSSPPQAVAAPGAAPRAAADPVATLPPEAVEAAAAALFADGPGGPPGAQTSIDFTCEYCDAAVSVPVAEAGKRVPCPECRRILKVPAAAKVDPSNWRRADMHLPSAAKAPDQPVPEGAWGNLTRTVVSREALEEADAIPEKAEPVTLRERVSFWGRIVVGIAAALLLVQYGYNHVTANRERNSAESVLAYIAEPNTIAQIGPERLGALHTLAGTYHLRTRVPYSDAPVDKQPGSGEQARIEFGHALKVLKSDGAGSADTDLALTDLAVAMVELGGNEEQENSRLRITWEDCQRLILAALSSIHSPEAKLEAYRAVCQRLIARDRSTRAIALASSAFSESPAGKAAARAICALELLEGKPDNTSAAVNLFDQVLRDFEAKPPPPLAAEVVTAAIVLGKSPPAPGKLPEEDDNAWIGDAEGLARKGQLPKGREQANTAALKSVRFRSLVAVGSATKQGAEDLSTACKLALEGLPDPGHEVWVLLRLVRLGAKAGLPDEILRKVADNIKDPAIAARARLELFRGQLASLKEPADMALADAVGTQTLSGALARADLARHNTRFDRGYYREASSWPEPLWAFGTLGAPLGLQKDTD